MRYTSEQIIIFVTSLPTILLCTSIAFLRFQKVPFTLKLLCLLIFFAFLTEIISRILWLYKTPNLFLVPIYTAVEFGLLLWMYSIILEINLLIRARLCILLFFLGLLFGHEFFESNKLLFNNVGRLTESGMVIGLALAYFYQTFRELRVQRLEREPLFWVSAGLLFFFSGNVFIFIFVNFVSYYSKPLNYQFWIIHAFLNALLYCAYAYALWLSPKK